MKRSAYAVIGRRYTHSFTALIAAELATGNDDCELGRLVRESYNAQVFAETGQAYRDVLSQIPHPEGIAK